MSPMDRSSLVVGTSSTGMDREQSRLPSSPGWIFGLREPSTRGGSHPISSSSPTCNKRSARLSTSIRLGFASTKCGSWYPLASDSTSMRAPPTSFASEPRVGMEETTWRTASSAIMWISTSARARNSVGMRAMRAHGILELQEGRRRPLRLRLREQPGGSARTLRVQVGSQPREFARLERQRRAQATGAGQDGAGGHADDVAADAEEPAARELRDDLGVAAAVPLAHDAVAGIQVT